MNGYSTLMHYIALGRYIVIKVEYTAVALQNSLTNQKKNNNNHYTTHEFGLFDYVIIHVKIPDYSIFSRRPILEASPGLS